MLNSILLFGNRSFTFKKIWSSGWYTAVKKKISWLWWSNLYLPSLSRISPFFLTGRVTNINDYILWPGPSNCLATRESLISVMAHSTNDPPPSLLLSVVFIHQKPNNTKITFPPLPLPNNDYHRTVFANVADTRKSQKWFFKIFSFLSLGVNIHNRL